MKLPSTLGQFLNKDSVKPVIQFIKFGIVGASNTLISLAFYYLFLFINPDLFIIGYSVGFIVSVFNAYFWNRKFVFAKKTDGHVKPIIKTFIVYGTTFLISSCLLWIMVNHLGVPDEIAPIIILFFTVPANFFLVKLWALKESPKSGSENKTDA